MERKAGIWGIYTLSASSGTPLPEIYMVFAVTCWTWFERTFTVNGIVNRADLTSTVVKWIPRT